LQLIKKRHLLDLFPRDFLDIRPALRGDLRFVLPCYSQRDSAAQIDNVEAKMLPARPGGGREIPRKRSRRCRFLSTARISPEESQKMAERLAQQPEQFVQAMAQSELVGPSTVFPISGPPRCRPAFRLQWRSFRLFRLFFSGGVEAVIISFASVWSRISPSAR